MALLFIILASVTFPLVAVRPFFGLPVSDLSYFLSFFALLFETSLNKYKILRSSIYNPFWLPVFFVFLGGLLSSFFLSPNVSESFTATLKSVFVFLLMPFLVMSLIKDEKKIAYVINSLIVGILFSSGIAIIDSIFGVQIGPRISINNVENIYYGSFGRFAGAAFHPNFQGNFIAVCMPLIVDLIFINHKKLKKLGFYVFSFFICTYALILSGSVGSILATLGGVSLLLGLRVIRTYRGRFLLKFVVVSCLLLILLIIIFGGYYDLTKLVLGLGEKNPNISRVVNYTYASRAYANEYALKEVFKHPFIGVGMDNESQSLYLPVGKNGETFAVHNALIRQWLGGGFFVLLGYLIMYFYAVRAVYYVSRAYLVGIDILYTLGLAGAVLAFIMFDMVQPNPHVRITWFLFFLLFRVYSLAVNKKSLKKDSSMFRVGSIMKV